MNLSPVIGFRTNPIQQKKNRAFGMMTPEEELELMMKLARRSYVGIEVERTLFGKINLENLGLERAEMHTLADIIEENEARAINNPHLQELLIHAKKVLNRLMNTLGIPVSETIKN